MSFSVRPKEYDRTDTVRLFLDGQLDAAGAPVFENLVGGALTPETKILILDMYHLSFISSAGLRVFAKMRNVMKQRNGQFLLVNVKPQVQRVFEIVKAIRVADIFVSYAELEAYLKTLPT